MKELSTEEKAKRYDEAIKVAREYWNSPRTCIDIDVLSILFSELKESEDEKIRKEIIGYIDSEYRHTLDLYRKNRFIAWLEKQGEQPSDTDNKFIRMRETKPKDISEFLDRLTTVEQEFLWEHIAKIRELDKKEQKPADKVEPKFNIGDKIVGIISGMQYYITKVCDYYYYTESGCIIMFCAQNNFELVEQNPVWSEEDEKRLQFCLNILQAKGIMGVTETINTKWLKSLKDRILSKQEWSEEDEKLLNNAITACNHCYFPTTANWLKSLRPQKQWKPSDDLPHWKKSTLPDDDTTGFNSDYFCHNGYYINYKELFEKLPKDD